MSVSMVTALSISGEWALSVSVVTGRSRIVESGRCRLEWWQGGVG